MSRRGTVLTVGGLLLLALGLWIRLHNAQTIGLSAQHDATYHLRYLIKLAILQPYATYNAPWYYVIILILGLPFVIAYDLGQSDAFTMLIRSVYVANSVLLVVFMAGLFALARRLRFTPAESLLFVGLAIAVPATNRSLNMARPENLILVLAPWILACLITVSLRSRRPDARVLASREFWWFAGLGGVAAAQKAGGLTLLGAAALMAFPLARGGLRSRLRQAAWPIMAAAGVLVVLVLLQGVLFGSSPFKHERVSPSKYASVPAPSFYWYIDPGRVWHNPFRDEHRDSMPSILLIDLFGDYWRYGIDFFRNRFPDEFRLHRARLGFGLSVVLVLGAVAATGQLVAAVRRRPSGPMRATAYVRLLTLAPVATAYLYLLSATRVYFAKADADVVKWEYIIWVIPLLMIPLVSGLRHRSRAFTIAGYAVLLVLIAGGVALSAIQNDGTLPNPATRAGVNYLEVWVPK